MPPVVCDRHRFRHALQHPGLGAHRLFRPLTLSDVLGQADEAPQATCRTVQRGSRKADLDGGAVFTLLRDFSAHEGLSLQHPVQDRQGFLRFLRGDGQGQTALDFLQAPAEDALRGRIDADHLTFGIEDPDGQGRSRKQGLQVVVGLP